METIAKLLTFLTNIVTVLTLPLMILNMFGGIFSGIWLAILGEWRIIIYGIIVMLVSGLLLPYLLSFGQIFAGPSNTMFENGNRIGGYFFGLLSYIYTMVALSLFSISVFIYHAHISNYNSIIPILLWSYGVATSSIIWLAQKEYQQGNMYAPTTAFFIEISYIITIILTLLFDTEISTVYFVFFIGMTFCFILQFINVYIDDNYETRY